MPHESSFGNVHATFELLEVESPPVEHVSHFCPLVEQSEDVQGFADLVSTLLDLEHTKGKKKKCVEKMVGTFHRLVCS